MVDNKNKEDHSGGFGKDIDLLGGLPEVTVNDPLSSYQNPTSNDLLRDDESVDVAVVGLLKLFGRSGSKAKPKVKPAVTLTGVAKNARWAKSTQNNSGPGLRDHFKKHGSQVGAKSTKEYDMSARMTIQNGRKFTYRDRSSGEPRVGYYDKDKGLFTATSQTRKEPTIMTHFPESWSNLRKLPGFSVN